jgi:outer membrane receptor protein involved in Fe transport
VLTAAVCLCLFAEASALAADQALFDEVTVTATRRSTDIESVAAAVSVVPGSRVAIEQLAVDSLADAVGGYVQQTTPGQGAAVVRGLKGSAVLHMVDGMRLNNAIFRTAPTQYFALVPGTAVERIELVRGTPASLYGSDAVGGVVQVVTRRPVFNQARPEVAGDLYASYATADDARRIGGTLDAGSATWHASVSGEYLKTGDRRTGGGITVAPSGFEARALRAAFGVSAGEDVDWLFDVHYYDQPETPRVDELVPGFGESEPASSEFLFAPNRRIYLNARRERRAGLGGLDWTAALAWQRIDDDRITRDFGAPDRRIETNRSDLLGLLVTAGADSDRGSWLAGMEVYADDVSSSRLAQDITTGVTTVVTPRFPDGSTVLQGSIFVNGSHDITRRMSLSGGLRWSEVRVELPGMMNVPGTTVSTGDVAGDLGLVVRFARSWRWTANVGAGFRAPNVFDLGTVGARPGNRFNIPNPNLDSEDVLQFDTGLHFSGEQVQFEIVAYGLRYDDRIVSIDTGQVTPGGRDVVRSVNAARSDIVGVEAGAIVALSDALRLRAVLNATRGDQRVEGRAEEPSDRIPPLGGSLELYYDSGDAWQAAAWLRFADRQSRLSARDVRDSRIDPNGTPGWGMLGGQVTWLPDARWSLSLAIDNVLDKRYRVHGSGLDAPGRNVSLRVRRQF